MSKLPPSSFPPPPPRNPLNFRIKIHPHCRGEGSPGPASLKYGIETGTAGGKSGETREASTFPRQADKSGAGGGKETAVLLIKGGGGARGRGGENTPKPGSPRGEQCGAAPAPPGRGRERGSRGRRDEGGQCAGVLALPLTTSRRRFYLTLLALLLFSPRAPPHFRFFAGGGGAGAARWRRRQQQQQVAGAVTEPAGRRPRRRPARFAPLP